MELNLQSDSQDLPIQESPKEKNFFQHNKVLIMTILIILVILLGVSIYVSFLIGNIHKEPSPTNNIQPSPAASASILDPTAAWKTYSNEEYGFEIKYPKELNEDFSVNESRTIKDPYLYSGRLYVQCMGKRKEGEEIEDLTGEYVSISVASNKVNLPVKDWIEEYEKQRYLEGIVGESEWENIQFKEFEFAGEEGLKVDFMRDPDIAGGCRPQIYLSKNSKIYVLGICRYEAALGKCTSKADKDQILSTFKFIN